MEIINTSSKPTIESAPKRDCFDSIWQYNNELREENLKLKAKLAFMEHEVKLLLPAAFFLRTRDALHQVLRRYVTLADACRAYQRNPSKDKITNILAALKAIEAGDKF